MDSTRLRFSAGSLESSMRCLASAAGEFLRESSNATARLASQIGEAVNTSGAMPSMEATTHKVPCCPPIEVCPPQCILEITRRAHAGEVILVPFRIRNASAVPKTYQVGIRPLVDEQQKPAPSQPTLNKTAVTIAPQQSALLEMRIDLSAQGWVTGAEYQATIVVREQEINQNICFRLVLDAFSNIPQATPFDEKDLRTHFVGWHHHYFCEEKPPRLITVTEPGTNAGATPATPKKSKKAKSE